MIHLPAVIEQRAVDNQVPRESLFRRHLPAVVFFALASVVFTWPLAREMRDTLISWGDPVFQSWTIAWNWHALTTDPLTIFDANVFYPWGNTLAYSDHLFGQSILVAPIMAITENGVLADNVSTLLAFFLSGLAMYLLAYDLTGSRVAGIIAGLAYAYAPSRMAHLEHLHLLSAQWPPLALLCLRRVARGGSPQVSRWLLALGGVFFAQGLFGIYFFYFTVVMLLLAGGTYAVLALLDRDWGMIRRLALAGVACGIAGVLLLPTLLPYLDVNNDLGIERSEEEVSFWSATPRDYIAVWDRNRAWNELLGGNHRDVEQDLFPGAVLVVLALLGLTNRRASRDRWVLLVVTLGSVVLSFGLRTEMLGVNLPLPYQAFYDVVPGFRAIRVPARLGLLALVGLGALAALGVAQLLRILRDEMPLFPWYPQRLTRSPRIAGWLTVILLTGAVTLETLTRIELPDPLPVPTPANEIRPDYVWLRDNPAPTLELPMGEGPVASAWPNYWSMIHWNDTVNGYSGIVPPTYYPFRERMNAFPSDDTLWLLQGIGVENIVLHGDFSSGARAEVEAAIAGQPELTLALAGIDAVYTLAPDPWMWRLADAVPEGQTVDLPAASIDPLAFGLLLAILQRTDHTVTGNGQVDYYTFTPAEEPRCYVILPTDIDPSRHGYDNAEVVLQEPGMTLYRNADCVAQVPISTSPSPSALP